MKRPSRDKHAIPEGEAFSDYVEEKPKRGVKRPGGHQFRMSDAHRVKIQNSNILSCLLEHVQGKREMAATQVTAGVALLKKVLPDLQSVTIAGDASRPIFHQHEHDLTVYSDADLTDLLRIVGKESRAKVRDNA